MGKKISQLNANELPYDGHELVAIVEAGETRGGTLSSFMNYLTGGVYDSLGGTPGVQPIASPLKNNFFIHFMLGPSWLSLFAFCDNVLDECLISSKSENIESFRH